MRGGIRVRWKELASFSSISTWKVVTLSHPSRKIIGDYGDKRDAFQLESLCRSDGHDRPLV